MYGKCDTYNIKSKSIFLSGMRILLNMLLIMLAKVCFNLSAEITK